MGGHLKLLVAAIKIVWIIKHGVLRDPRPMEINGNRGLLNRADRKAN